VRSGRCTGCGLCESLAGRDRIQMGIMVLMFLAVLFILAYLLKLDYWRELH